MAGQEHDAPQEVVQLCALGQLPPLPASDDDYDAEVEAQQLARIAELLEPLVCTDKRAQSARHGSVAALAIAATVLVLRTRSTPAARELHSKGKLPQPLTNIFAYLGKLGPGFLSNALPLRPAVALAGLAWKIMEVRNTLPGGELPWALVNPGGEFDVAFTETLFAKLLSEALEVIETGVWPNSEVCHPIEPQSLVRWMVSIATDQSVEFRRRVIRHKDFERLLRLATRAPLVHHACGSSDDPLGAGSELCIDAFGLISWCYWFVGKGEPALFTESVHLFMKTGLLRWVCKYIVGVPSAAATGCPISSFLPFGLVFLQQAAQADGCITHILENANDCTGCSSAELHEALMYVVEHAKAHGFPPGAGVFPADVRAAMAIGVLFGREEAGEGASTVPAAVSAQLVSMLKAIVNGKNPGSLVAACDIVLSLSISDANTANLVASGILEVITLVLTQGQDVLDAREVSNLRYNIAQAREAASAVLLNLALSPHSCEAVLAHDSVQAGIVAAVADTQNLSARAKKRLSDTQMALKMALEPPPSESTGASPRQEGEKDDGRHLMLSYCWAQQEMVLRLRKALGARGYRIWIDVEAMQGSTVEGASTDLDLVHARSQIVLQLRLLLLRVSAAMADALDGSYCVCFGVSKAYKESANVRSFY